MTLRLMTLGTLGAFLGEEELASLPGKPVSFGLLVYLAVEREATRDRLISIFWPENTQERARRALNQTLYELRQTLGEEWVESAGASVRVPDSLWVDSIEFLENTDAGQHDQAVGLYHGPFLDGAHLTQTQPFEEWVDTYRGRLCRRFRAAADSVIKACRSRGDCEVALQAAWKWVGFDPLDDGAQQHLIQLLADTGSRTEALAQFERYRAILDTELGLEPLEKTVALVEAIRDGSHQPPAPPPPEDWKGPVEPAVQGEIQESAWPAPLPAEVAAGVALKAADDRVALQETMLKELAPSLEILRPIGEGSMARVFLGREPHLRRLVAVKVLSPHLSANYTARKRFEREAQAAASIQHPNVCIVLRVGSLEDGTPYLVTPFVKGTSMAQRLKAEGRLGPDEVRRVLLDVASALAAAHKLGFVHRDVRPANVLREEESGRHKLCDFGIAGVLETGDPAEPRLTLPGERLSQPDYASPEQNEAKPLTDRSDLYSLGILGYKLLTGHLPGRVDGVGKEKGTRVELGPLTEYLGDTDPGLVKLLGHCLAEEPAHRPSAADVERKLQEPPPSGPGLNLEEFSEVNLGRLIFKKRLLQILGAYVAGGWIAIEAAGEFQSRDIVSESLFWQTVVTVLFGFFGVSVVGWYHGEKGRQTMPAVEKWLLGVLGVGWIASVIWVAARF